jgi:hypothetical protein
MNTAVVSRLHNNIHSQLCKHIAVLTWLDAKTEPEGSGYDSSDYDPKPFCVTAFVICVHSLWFLSTAGHILSDLQGRLQAGRRIIKARLIGGFEPGKHIMSNPFALGEAKQRYEYTNGTDYAFICLRPHDIRLLRADGVEPLTEVHWSGIPSSMGTEVEHMLLGLPTQAQKVMLTEASNGGRVNLDLRIPSIPLSPEASPHGTPQNTNGRFYACVPVAKGDFSDGTITVTDIDGMSGGPIFAVQRGQDNSLRYWIKAIQSGWFRARRILVGCPVQQLITGITDFIDSHVEELQEYKVDLVS